MDPPWIVSVAGEQYPEEERNSAQACKEVRVPCTTWKRIVILAKYEGCQSGEELLRRGFVKILNIVLPTLEGLKGSHLKVIKYILLVLL